MYDLTIEEYTYFNNYLRGLENYHKHKNTIRKQREIQENYKNIIRTL